MQNMAYSTAELAEKQKEFKGESIGNMPKYPWGLELRLGDEVLKKLGATMPDVGGEVTITAKAMVTGKNARQEADGDTRASVELQITAMELSNAPDTTNAASDLYGKK